MSAGPPRAGVIGWPVRHSRSPLIHGFWLSQLQLAGSYEHLAVPPDELAGFVAGLHHNGFAGANVTVPHKEAALGMCAALTETARELGAVNTLWFEAGRLHGDNTDVGGFLANLDECAPGWDDGLETAVVVGAGGAARAVLHGLRQRGVRRCVLINRTLSRAVEVAAQASRPPTFVVAAASWTDWRSQAAQAGLVVNTTTLGMVGQPELEFDLAPLPDHAIVSDIVYVPLETRLLTAARARGLRTVGGLGMLLHQAVPGFEHWFGARPRVTAELRALVVADIERAAAGKPAAPS